MNPIQLYKELPKTNCGQCGYKTCMAFSISVNKGDEAVTACPYLDKEKAQEIAGAIKIVDWRENVIKSLKEDIAQVDLAQVAAGLGAEVLPDGIKIRCIGRDYLLSANREITAQGKVTPWQKILLLLYVKTGGSGALSGQWISFEELRGGQVKVEAIRKECEVPLGRMFGKNQEAMVQALQELGAESMEGEIAGKSWVCRLFPLIPARILYWPQDDEFPARAKVLFDKTADRFLDVESIVFLCESFVEVLKEMTGMEE